MKLDHTTDSNCAQAQKVLQGVIGRLAGMRWTLDYDATVESLSLKIEGTSASEEPEPETPPESESEL